jgi:hypothetical protein
MNQKTEVSRVMSKQTIAVDIDDVLVAHIPSIIEFSNYAHTRNETVNDKVIRMANWKEAREYFGV